MYSRERELQKNNMRDYELTYIVKPDVEAASLQAIIERVNGFVTAEGGTVAKLDQWGMRRLSYAINKYREGQYVFSLLKLNAASIAKIESRLRLQEDILRYLLVKAEETGRPVTPPAQAEPAAAEAGEDVAAAPVASAEAPETEAAAAPASTSAPTPAAQ